MSTIHMNMTMAMPAATSSTSRQIIVKDAGAADLTIANRNQQRRSRSAFPLLENERHHHQSNHSCSRSRRTSQLQPPSSILQQPPLPSSASPSSASNNNNTVNVNNSNNNNNKKKHRRSVHFSPTSRVTLLPRPTPSQLRSQWYTPSEKTALERSFARSVGAMALKRSRSEIPLSQFRTEELYECLGMEGKCSLEVMDCVQRGKRGHVRGVLARQEEMGRRCRLRWMDDNNDIAAVAAEEQDRYEGEEELARLSRKSSGGACERARRAAGYWSRIL